ncbi:MAG: DNA gyrase C-terminal beta-propeller domain-containing protein, partial [Ignavibacteria bacterium]|nr:DNA gyrase C-terminal beta-propeller domain-containing protein [Ignavibacteria bacterium]
KVHEVPEGGRATRGRSILNLIEKEKDEDITAFVNVKEFKDDQYLIMATARGTIKKTVLSAYGNVRRGGINAININDGDRLIAVKITDGTNDIVLGTSHGLAIRFHEKDVRDMGRTSTGVRGVKLGKDDLVVGLLVIKRQGSILVVTENGFGKRSDINDYRITKRGGKGVITVKTTDKVGKMISMMEVTDNEELMIISSQGMAIRQSVKDIRVMGRNTQGVRVIRLKDDDAIADIAKVVPEDEVVINGNGELPV